MNTRTSATPGLVFQTHWTVTTAVQLRNRARARKAWDILESVCVLTGHVGCCGLLNRGYAPAIEIRGHWFTLPLPGFRNPLYGLVWRIADKARR